jgi:formamidopyrimidine-DNA glycosylase
MPELPEVETVRLGLDRLMRGEVFEAVEILNPGSFSVPQNEIKNALLGSRALGARRRAKVLIIDLSSSYSLVIHLKMTGQLVFDGNEHFGAGHPNDSLIGKMPDKSTRVIFKFESGAKLYLNDQRKFGWIKLIPTSEVESLAFIKKLGPEPLEDSFTPALFRSQVKKRSGALVKAALLDQTVLSGIGNIYADESLWRARIHPKTRVSRLKAQEINLLHGAIIEVLQTSVDLGGSSDKNYVNAEGKKGSFLAFAKVFRREGQLCERCASEIIKTRVAGRGTHTCPKCQVEK